MKLNEKKAKWVLKQLAKQGKEQAKNGSPLTKVFEKLCDQLVKKFEDENKDIKVVDYVGLKSQIESKEYVDPWVFYPLSLFKIMKSSYPLSLDSKEGIEALKKLYEDCVMKGDYDAAEALLDFFAEFKIKVEEKWHLEQKQRIINLKEILKSLPLLDFLEELEKDYKKIEEKYIELKKNNEYERIKTLLHYARSLIDPHTYEEKDIDFLNWVEKQWSTIEKINIENTTKEFEKFKKDYPQILIENSEKAVNKLLYYEKNIFSGEHRPWIERQKNLITPIEKDTSQEFIVKLFLKTQFEAIKDKNLQNAKLCSIYISMIIKKHGFNSFKVYLEENILLAKNVFGENEYNNEKAINNTTEALELLCEMSLHLEQADRTVEEYKIGSKSYQIAAMENFINNDSGLSENAILILNNKVEKAGDEKNEDFYINQFTLSFKDKDVKKTEEFDLSVQQLVDFLKEQKILKNTTELEEILKKFVLLRVNAALDEKKYVKAFNFLNKISKDYLSNWLREEWMKVFLLLIENNYEEEGNYTEASGLLKDVLKKKPLGNEFSYEKIQEKLKKIENKIYSESQQIVMFGPGIELKEGILNNVEKKVENKIN